MDNTYILWLNGKNNRKEYDKMSKIFIIMGKSATGKDTLFQLLKEDPRLTLKSVVGYTTRPIRYGETEGIEYFFVTEDKLQEFKDNNKVIEHRAYKTMHGIWNYFTVDDGQINLEIDNYILIGTLEVYEQIRNYFGPNQVVPIYVEVEDGLRLSRALKRERKQETPKYAELCRRFLADDSDFSEENLKRLNIHNRYENKTIKTCLNEIIKDIQLIIEEDKVSN